MSKIRYDNKESPNLFHQMEFPTYLFKDDKDKKRPTPLPTSCSGCSNCGSCSR